MCAQEYPHAEAFGGFSYAHINLGQQGGVFQPTGQNYYGIHLNISVNPASYLRVLLCDFSVQMGSTTAQAVPERTDLRTSQVLFGPEFTVRSDRAVAFAHTLIGITNTRLVGSLGGSDVEPDIARRTNLALGFGGGVDIPLGRLMAIRAFQADYIPTRISGTWENHFRVSTGVTFRFKYSQQGGR